MKGYKVKFKKNKEEILGTIYDSYMYRGGSSVSYTKYLIIDEDGDIHHVEPTYLKEIIGIDESYISNEYNF